MRFFRLGFLAYTCATQPIDAARRLSLSTLHDFSAKKIGGGDTSFSAYKGKPVLILNVAAI